MKRFATVALLSSSTLVLACGSAPGDETSMQIAPHPASFCFENDVTKGFCGSDNGGASGRTNETGGGGTNASDTARMCMDDCVREQSMCVATCAAFRGSAFLTKVGSVRVGVPGNPSDPSAQPVCIAGCVTERNQCITDCAQALVGALTP